MIKPLRVVSPFLVFSLASAALADPYANVENNGAAFMATIIWVNLDMHVGYEVVMALIPSISKAVLPLFHLMVWTAKLSCPARFGGSVAVSENFGVYAELSGIDWRRACHWLKIGMKRTFD